MHIHFLMGMLWMQQDSFSELIAVKQFGSNGEQQSYKGDFTVKEEEGKKYVDIYFPSVEQVYQQLKITGEAIQAEKAELVQTERMTSDGTVDVSWFGFNSIQMTVDAPTEGYVTLLQSKHSGWTAYVDGKKADISTVNRCFMGLHVTRGKHTITMKFRPVQIRNQQKTQRFVPDLHRLVVMHDQIAEFAVYDLL